MRTVFQGKEMKTQQAQFMHWLQAILTDEKLRVALRALLQQYELPVIELGRAELQQIRKGTARNRIQPMSRVRRINRAEKDTSV